MMVNECYIAPIAAAATEVQVKEEDKKATV